MLHPLGRLSKRKIIALVMATIALIFSYLIFAAPAAHAADAEWREGVLVYDGKEFTVAQEGEGLEELNLPEGSRIYTHTGGFIPFVGTEVETIYFPDGADLENLDEAQYVTYRALNGSVRNVSEPSTITVDNTTAAQSDAVSDENSESGASSCQIDGLGWIICPLTTTLARGMDWVFGVVAEFLKVRPLETTSSDNVMLRAWSAMRVIANIAFVIAFLIIIYSQLTSMGIGNYGVKKMLPRLVVAAILVNISYWICAIAIDLSNILGIALQDMFIQMRNVVLGSSTNSWDLISWESITGFILSGGALGAATAIAGVGTLASIGAAGVGAVYLLFPILVGALLSVLVVLLILSARQAILTILVVIAPLAFVAYLLPNTEKWFEKWRDLFINMLILFPAFSVVFGGAQLAGILIIQNADDITVVLLGMAIQIAPLAIVPLLLKLGGNVLTRIAGIVNNPNKGMLDRTKKWSQGRYDQSAAAGMRRNRNMAATGELKKKRNALRRYAVYRDDDKREREGLQKVDEGVSDALFSQSSRGFALREAEEQANKFTETVKTDIEARLKKIEIDPNSTLHADNVRLEVSKMELNKRNNIAEEQLAAYRAGTAIDAKGNEIDLASMSQESRLLANNMRDMSRNVAVSGLATESAKRREQTEFSNYLQGKGTGLSDVEAKALQSEAALQRMRAGSIEGERGAERALATQIKKESSAYEEAVTNSGAILNANNYDNISMVNAYHTGNSDYLGGVSVTEDMKAAIARKVLKGGDTNAIEKFMEKANLNSDQGDLLVEIGDSLQQSAARPKWATAGYLDQIRQGYGDVEVIDRDPVTNKPTVTRDIKPENRITEAVFRAVTADKYNAADVMVAEDKTYLKELNAVLSDKGMRTRIEGTAGGKEKLAKIRQQIQVAVQSPQYRGKIGDRDEVLEKIYNSLNAYNITDDTGANTLEPTYEDAKRHAK